MGDLSKAADPGGSGRGYPALADREAVLDALTRLIGEAWDSFEHPRREEPELEADLAERLELGLPELPGDASMVLSDAARILDESNSPSRPLYLGYIGSTGLEVGVLAEALAATYDVNLAVTARAADLIERQSLEWVSEFVGFPAAEGAFTSGGMISNLTAILVARERALPGCRHEGFAGRTGTAYCSEEAHHSIVRAAEAAGLGSDNVRAIPIGPDRRLPAGALDAAIRADLEAGRVPVVVIANGGTTLTGTVDPIASVADVCEEHGVWLHVDGAYGLAAAGTERAAPLFAGLERADSAILDAHKWLGLQKSCSVVLIRERGLLEATFGHEESYMRRADSIRNAVERTLEYSRPLRSLKLWLAFRTHGAEAFRGWITGTLDLAEAFADGVRSRDEFELMCEPSLSTVCFRHLPDFDADLDAHNLKLAERIQRDGRVYLAAATVDGQTCLRVCFVNFRTRSEDVDFALNTVAELGAST